LDRLASRGFDWIWLLSVWQTGSTAQRISQSNPEWRREFQATLSDLCDDDIAGSGFAITGYSVHTSLGGDAALARLRERLRERGLRLMLDFVPNHMGLGHPWVDTHPEYFVAGTEIDLARAPQNYTRVRSKKGDLLLAYGRDPYFAGWPDTLQIDYSNRHAQDAMVDELKRIAQQCDGVRCDMAMLVLPDVFERTWGRKADLFWPRATAAVRAEHPEFCFMAEVYWDLEWTLQHQGFNYAYDKRLYDRLREGCARSIREHFWAGLDYQDKLARFLENHDEPRAAAVFAPEVQQAAAVITFLSPGLRFFHRGQFEGCRVRVSPHLVRGPIEPCHAETRQFYDRLLNTLRDPVVRDGNWRLAECKPAWAGNGSADSFIAFAWEHEGRRRLVAVNFAPHPSQCRVTLPFTELGGGNWRLQDRLSEAVYDRSGDDLQANGLYLAVGPWHTHVFDLSRS
jgi:glycosidase